MSADGSSSEDRELGAGYDGAAPELSAVYQAASTAPGMRADRLRTLVSEFGTLEAVLNAPPARLALALEDRPHVAAALPGHVRRRLPGATRQVKAALAAGMSVITWEHSAYPGCLRDDPDGCAPILFVEGRLPDQLRYPSPTVRSFAVVGTRRATPGGLGFARDVGRALSREGVVVVSGLAIGIDGAAHEGAVEAVERSRAGASLPRHYEWKPGVSPTARPAGTVAVLGGGHGHLHPAGHAGLARRILESGGAVISQWAPDVPPLPYRFLQRNRVISGLSRGVLVVEAGARSGTNNTVAHALNQGRETMAVPAAPWSASGASCFAMIRDGAEFAFGYMDVLAKFPELAWRGATEPSAEPPRTGLNAPAPETPPLFAATAEREPAPAGSEDGGWAGDAESMVRRIMSSGTEVGLDHLVAATAYPPGILIGVLSMLELAGAVESTPGGYYRLREALTREPE